MYKFLHQLKSLLGIHPDHDVRSNITVNAYGKQDMFDINPNNWTGPVRHTQSMDMTFSFQYVQINIDALTEMITGMPDNLDDLYMNDLLSSQECLPVFLLLHNYNEVYEKISTLISRAAVISHERSILEQHAELVKKITGMLNVFIQAGFSGSPNVVSEGKKLSGSDYFQETVELFTDFILNNKTVYELYDKCVFNMTAWEHMGYELREYIRLIDYSIIIINMLLQKAYCQKKTSPEEEKIISLFRKNQVIRHKNIAICQIAGAHVIMTKFLNYRDYIHMPWFPVNTEWTDRNGESAWYMIWGPESGINYNKSLSTEEFAAICNYYEDLEGYSNFADILRKDADIHFDCTGDEAAYLLLQGDVIKYYDSGECYFICAGSACEMTSSSSYSQEVIGSACITNRFLLTGKKHFRFWNNLDPLHKWFITDVIERYE